MCNKFAAAVAALAAVALRWCCNLVNFAYSKVAASQQQQQQEQQLQKGQVQTRLVLSYSL